MRLNSRRNCDQRQRTLFFDVLKLIALIPSFSLGRLTLRLKRLAGRLAHAVRGLGFLAWVRICVLFFT